MPCVRLSKDFPGLPGRGPTATINPFKFSADLFR